MNTVIDYGNIGRTEAIENFINYRLIKFNPYFLDDGLVYIKIWMKRLNSLNSHGEPDYKVALKLKYKKFPILYISKNGNSLYKVLGRVFKASIENLKTKNINNKNKKFVRIKNLIMPSATPPID